jgi:hypothetical protein
MRLTNRSSGCCCCMSQVAHPELVPLNQEMDCPDGFIPQEAVWIKLQVGSAGRALCEWCHDVKAGLERGRGCVCVRVCVWIICILWRSVPWVVLMASRVCEQELRNAKIIKEFEVREANMKLSELKRSFDGLLSEGEALEAQISSIHAKKFDTAETMAFKERNTEVMVRLKQVRVRRMGFGFRG